ncbi:hypothetical protein KHA80_10865 [Anaerobacillus sp. HL2]|nr:hypothetical protein KHA80_10865 [Anaerobacillus sp. HL2]
MGDSNDLEALVTSVDDWKGIRDRTINYMRTGERDKAANITREEGAVQVGLIEKNIEKIIDFAINKGNSLYGEINTTREQTIT